MKNQVNKAGLMSVQVVLIASAVALELIASFRELLFAQIFVQLFSFFAYYPPCLLLDSDSYYARLTYAHK